MGLETATIIGILGVTASAAGTYASYAASQDQAKQSKLNADAQAQALALERQRQQLETEQAQSRKAQEQQRFRAAQEAGLANNGTLSTTGSPLDILADTYTAQQRELSDMGYARDTNAWSLSSSASAAVGSARSQSSAIMGQAGGTLLSNLGSTAQMASDTNWTGSGGNSPIPVGYKPRPLSQRPAGY